MLNANRSFREPFRHLAVIVGVAALTGLACGSAPSEPAAPAVTADTWAVVDGRRITEADVDRAYRQSQDADPAQSENQIQLAKLTLLDDLILQDILVARAAALKLEISENELDAGYADAKGNATDEQFQGALTARNLSTSDVREAIRRDMLARRAIERDVGSPTVTDQEVSDFFATNKAQFNLAEETYRIAQIVVTPIADPQLANRTGDDATTAAAAATKVKTLMERLKGGASFADLARDYSEDPETAPRGGDLGLIPVSRVRQAPPNLRNAVLDKEPGTVNVVSESGGHAIVLVVGREPAGQRDLSSPGVRDGIVNALRAQKTELARAAYLAAVRTDANVTNYQARRLVQSIASPSTAAPAAESKAAK